MSSLASGNKLQPSVLHDTTGPYVIVMCGSVSGRLYLSKLDESKKPSPKCINVNGTWHSPPDVESLAGKKSKKWKQSLRHLDKPLSDFNLSVSHVITSQQGSSDNVNITVADNIDVSVSDVSGPVSDNLIRLALSLLTPLVLLCLPVSLSSLDLLLALNLCLLIQFSLLLLLIT